MRFALPALLLPLGLVAACQSSDVPEASDAPVEETGVVAATQATEPVTIVSTDFAFEAPASIEGGRREIRLVNRGAELHHIQFVRIDEGHDLDDLMAAYAAGDFHPAFAHDVGGPNPAAPGAEISATVDLKPGRYALLCVIPSPDMTLHVEKGMVMEMEVTEPTTVVPAPEPDLVLTMRDYSWDFSGPITAGTHTIRVETDAAQSHELVVFALGEGTSAQDVLTWIEAGQQGPPPFRPVGGVAALSAGETNEVTIDFAPGRYAFICFIPDAGDGAPHFVHGMIQEYTVT